MESGRTEKTLDMGKDWKEPQCPFKEQMNQRGWDKGIQMNSQEKQSMEITFEYRTALENFRLKDENFAKF